jgi:nucleotide-binding universal stress UspA family protein
MSHTRARERPAPGRSGGTPPRSPADATGRPILLATMDVPFDGFATAVAVDAAVESGQALIVANVVGLPPLPLSVVMGYDDLGYTDEMDRSLRAPAELARSFGLHVERLRVKSLHPVQALLELASERAPGLLVFGPDRAKLGRLRFRRTVRALRTRATCLVWLPD